MVLLNVPLLLHAAWQEHASALLREYLLASLDVDQSDRAIQVHADATDAMAILGEQIPRARVSVVPDELMRDATGPSVSRARVAVTVPTEAVTHFGILDDAIESALRMTETETFLTPPSQPEIQHLRRWLCRQVMRQADGDPATPWSINLGTSRPSTRPVDWDSTPVTTASAAVLAADDTSKIVAASPSALHILGYDNPDDLIGTRLVSIIPERFRQAHVAGLTMYLLTGRRPLLGQPITVPALRQDGTETIVELLINTQTTGDGHDVFIAVLSQPDETSTADAQS